MNLCMCNVYSERFTLSTAAQIMLVTRWRIERMRVYQSVGPVNRVTAVIRPVIISWGQHVGCYWIAFNHVLKSDKYDYSHPLAKPVKAWYRFQGYELTLQKDGNTRLIITCVRSVAQLKQAIVICAIYLQRALPSSFSPLPTTSIRLTLPPLIPDSAIIIQI